MSYEHNSKRLAREMLKYLRDRRGEEMFEHMFGEPEFDIDAAPRFDRRRICRQMSRHLRRRDEMRPARPPPAPRSRSVG